MNDNVDNMALEKVTMSSAKNFGISMINCGKNCVFAKPDIVDAYKNVPAKLPMRIYISKIITMNNEN